MAGRRRWAVLTMLLWLAGAVISSAQFRGLGRVTGSVTDDSGAPLKDVVIRATLTGEDGVLEDKTDPKGLWALNGMARGDWHLTFQSPGYVPVAAKVILTAELARVNPISVVLKKASK